MFLPPNERIASIESLLSLLEPKGRLAMTVRLGRSEPVRGLYAMTEADLVRLTGRWRTARLVHQDRSDDRFGRERVTWRTVVLEKVRQGRVCLAVPFWKIRNMDLVG